MNALLMGCYGVKNLGDEMMLFCLFYRLPKPAG
jgi:polysaccharide pyruvyl transferase WcaK-like protein